MKYLIVIEKAANNYAAYSPDVLGCVTTGTTIEETLEMMKAALEFHFESMIEDGEEIPKPKGLNFYIEQTSEISEADIIAHLDIETPELALA